MNNRIIIGVIGNDIHAVGLRIIHIALEESGFEVFNLGTNNMPIKFIEAALEVNPKAVLVSSINGEAEALCIGFGDMFSNYVSEDIKLYIGGNIVCGFKEKTEVDKIFLSYGFNRVFYQIAIHEALGTIERDCLYE
jgi:methylaspartate mutase sigma subunit